MSPSRPTDEIRHYLSGNLCRCASYLDIVEAVKMAAEAGEAPIAVEI